MGSLVISSSPVVVDNLDLSWALLGPEEADSVLLVDPNAPLARSVPLQLLKLVGRWCSEVLKHVGLIQLVQLPLRHGSQRRRAQPTCLLRCFSKEDILGAAVGERLDHAVL